MKRWKIVSVMFILFLSLAGCIQKNDETSADLADMVEVKLEVPEDEQIGKSVILQSHVTQGDETVDDADEVVFEIWKDGEKEESVMIDYTKKENGMYEAEMIFEEAGVYHVQVHVTARRMHVMPKTQIEITK